MYFGYPIRSQVGPIIEQRPWVEEKKSNMSFALNTDPNHNYISGSILVSFSDPIKCPGLIKKLYKSVHTKSYIN